MGRKKTVFELAVAYCKAEINYVYNVAVAVAVAVVNYKLRIFRFHTQALGVASLNNDQ